MRIRLSKAAIAATIVATSMLGAIPAGSALVGPGAPDPRFSGDGITRLKLGDLTFFSGIALHGRATVAAGSAQVNGEWDAVLARYTRRGSLDRSFSGDGKVRIDVGAYDAFNDVVVLPDGKLLAVGSSIGATRTRFLAMRFHPDGRLDRSFANSGVALTAFPDPEAQAFAALALPSGKVVACGLTRDLAADQSGFALARYRASGALDATFGGDGKVVTRFPVRSENVCTGLGLASDGQVVASGFVTSSGPGTTAAALARYRPNGALEASFDGDGRVEISLGNYTTGEDVLALPNNFFAIAGQWQRPGGGYAGYVAKVNTSGHLDMAFGKNGVRSVSVAGGDAKFVGLARAPGGKLVGVGEWSLNTSPFTQFALIARLKPGGGLDAGFGAGGIVTMPLAPSGDSSAAATQVLADGRIVFSGETESAGAVARLKG
jgi:uncharacterized delta-60 repeat protein